MLTFRGDPILSSTPNTNPSISYSSDEGLLDFFGYQIHFQTRDHWRAQSGVFGSQTKPNCWALHWYKVGEWQLKRTTCAYWNAMRGVKHHWAGTQAKIGGSSERGRSKPSANDECCLHQRILIRLCTKTLCSDEKEDDRVRYAKKGGRSFRKHHKACSEAINVQNKFESFTNIRA